MVGTNIKCVLEIDAALMGSSIFSAFYSVRLDKASVELSMQRLNCEGTGISEEDPVQVLLSRVAWFAKEMCADEVFLP
jgi:hypothetical protein